MQAEHERLVGDDVAAGEVGAEGTRQYVDGDVLAEQVLGEIPEKTCEENGRLDICENGSMC